MVATDTLSEEIILNAIRQEIKPRSGHSQKLIIAAYDLAKLHFGPEACKIKRSRASDSKFCLRSNFGLPLVDVNDISSLVFSSWTSVSNVKKYGNTPGYYHSIILPGDYLCVAEYTSHGYFNTYIIVGNKVGLMQTKLRGGITKSHFVNAHRGVIVGDFSLASPGSKTTLITRKLFHLARS